MEWNWNEFANHCEIVVIVGLVIGLFWKIIKRLIELYQKHIDNKKEIKIKEIELEIKKLEIGKENYEKVNNVI